MQSKEEIIKFALATGLIIPTVALCGEGHEEEEEKVMSDLPFEH
ncbi:hypothetical protein [Bacillus sp. 166amftsu]|nr:hypothetical protein [Bacillus sp. 166amftsu]SDY93721.1 hypothetical protein SAMN04488156_10385 [Bacillus sp. 166amftsu]